MAVAFLIVALLCDPSLRPMPAFFLAGAHNVPTTALDTCDSTGQRETNSRRKAWTISLVWDETGWLRRGEWRKRWDSNPRNARTLAGFQDRCLKPLGHSSVGFVSRLWAGMSSGGRCFPGEGAVDPRMWAGVGSTAIAGRAPACGAAGRPAAVTPW